MEQYYDYFNNMNAEVRDMHHSGDEDEEEGQEHQQTHYKEDKIYDQNENLQTDQTLQKGKNQFQQTSRNEIIVDKFNGVQNPETINIEENYLKKLIDDEELFQIINKKHPDILKQFKQGNNYQNIPLKIRTKTSLENLKDEIQYYRQNHILRDESKQYYQTQKDNNEQQNLQYNTKSILVQKVSDYEEKKWFISAYGIDDTSKNTNTQDLTIGRQQFLTLNQNGKIVTIRPNDITPNADETDTDISRMHCKIVYRPYIFEDQRLYGSYYSFVKIIEMTYQKIQNKAVKEGNINHLIQYKQLYKICKQILNLGFILPILKKFIIPERAAYLVDFKSQNGTKVFIHHEKYTRLYSHMIITIGVNSQIYFEQINNYEKMNSFEDIIVNCIYDQIRLNYEIENKKWQLEINSCYFGLDEEDEESEVFKVIQQVIKYYTEKQTKNVTFEDYFFSPMQKNEVFQKIKEFLTQSQQQHRYKYQQSKEFQSLTYEEKQQKNKQPLLFQNYRPYIRALVKYDDSNPHQIKPYYLFYNYQAPNRIFKIGRLDTNHIQIRFRHVSRKNTEIVYKNNQWLIRDGYDDSNQQRKASTEKTWINLTGFQSIPNLIQPDIQCVYSHQNMYNEEIGPYPIKHNDIIMCGKSQKFQIQYLENEKKLTNLEYLDIKMYS
ncbi:FHA domain protein (macronuclear) [Tetrahymena thermophila SB210]|uniref:FHA domain protein n=1 Tax=Tetrahymena thermophila (strain SB210) TaxID=312017 RepID=W7X7W1_TETTS|nr:FHA domain protein [Tetrahymena thermophila SB210]EWS73422.1 FHA domain protein [Tetrahymena thermophila SB210]|eukprot:XP_012654038.1 FHA domain protein [Tetrahymena thermophila SB210]